MRFSVFNPDAERRDGLKTLLRQIDRHASFHDAPDWRSADRTVQRFSPNLFVMDWHSGIGAGELCAFTTRHPALPIVALTDDASPSVVCNLLHEGARGVIPRTVDPRLIVRVFEIVLLGGSHAPVDALLHPTATATAKLSLSIPLLPAPVPGRGASLNAMPQHAQIVRSLSPRQKQIMRCVHMGSTNKMIARTLGISEGTVKIHLTSIFQQLGAPNRAAAVAIYNGWLSAQLQVLQTRSDQPLLNVHGQPCPIPLRARRNGWHYPPPADNDDALPMAAEPAVPFGETSARQEQEHDASVQRPVNGPLPLQNGPDDEDESVSGCTQKRPFTPIR